jgi:hypothetical protein
MSGVIGGEFIVGGDFSNIAVGYAAPDITGLQCLHLLGGTLAKSELNLAISGNGVAATQTGTVVVQADYVECNGYQNYLTTGTSSSTEMTIMYVGRYPTAPVTDPINDISFCGTFLSGSTGAGGFDAIVSVGSPPVLTVTGFYTPPGGGTLVPHAVALVTSGATVWEFIAMVFDSTGNALTLYNMTLGTVSSTTTAGTFTIPTANPLVRIGSTPLSQSGIYQGASDFGMFEVFNVTKTQSQIAASYASWKTTMAARGIAI